MTTAARSPSPGPMARPCCGGLRRSADSSPFRSTPDSTQRSASVGRNGSGGRASSRAEKENDNHHQHPRDGARTPKLDHRCNTGGAKSFMAPTISAASKVVAASPSSRKKVLGERNNDPTHPVASSSAGDLLAHAKPRVPAPTEEALSAPRRLRFSLDGDPAPPPPPSAAPARDAPPIEEALGTPRRLWVSLDGAPAAAPPPAAAELVPVGSHGAWCSLGGEARAEEVENPVCKANHHHEEPGAAAAPYDPKTNYLSPRPRFLHYRPNPRVEQYRQSGSRRRLEDGFAASSESSEESDTATTTATTGEEGLSEEEQESSPLSPLALDAGTDDPGAPVTAGALLQEPTAISPQARAPTPELDPAGTPAPVCAKKKKTKRFSLRFLFVAPLALVLFLAASLICVPPPPGAPVVLHASLSKASDYILSVQEVDPVELAAWLKQRSSSSLDFVASYWNALVSPQEPEFFGPPFAANLSAAAADDADRGVGFFYSAAETGPIPIEQESTSSNLLEQELEIQDVVSASDNVAESEVQEVAALGDATVEDEPTDYAEMVQEPVPETSNGLAVEEAQVAEEVSGTSGVEIGSFDQDLNTPFQSEPEPEDMEVEVPSLQQDLQTEESEGDQGDHVKEDQGAHNGQKLGSNMWSGYLDEFSKPAVAGSVLAVLVVSAALAFLYYRQNRARDSLSANEPAETAVERESVEKVEQVELPSGSHLMHSAVEESERVGDSDASQYSSSLSSGLSSRRGKGKAEQSLQSLEPGTRRESTGYSTSSYGSFTTYEKLSAKKKKKEEEVMTPVRRSSRLRNQVKTPEA